MHCFFCRFLLNKCCKKEKRSCIQLWTMFLASVRAGFIYLVSLRWPVATEASGSCEVARCWKCGVQPLHGVVISAISPQAGKPGTFFIGLIPHLIPPVSFMLLLGVLCVQWLKGVNACTYIDSDMWFHIHTWPLSECTRPQVWQMCEKQLN